LRQTSALSTRLPAKSLENQHSAISRQLFLGSPNPLGIRTMKLRAEG
jgi:hypothetical protein